MSIVLLTIKYPSLIPFQFASNSVVSNLDLDGREGVYYDTYISTYTGKNQPNLAPTTSFTVEDKGKEAQVNGMTHYGGPLGSGTRIDYYQTDSFVADGKVDRKVNYIGYLYIPGDDYENKSEARGGFYFVSKDGSYTHRSGRVDGSDATPISLDLLVKTVGNFPSNESAIESAKELFTTPSLSKTALSTLETIKNAEEGSEKGKTVLEIITENLGKKEKSKIDPVFTVPGRVVYRRFLHFKTENTDSLGHGKHTDKPATDTFPKNPD